MYININDDDPLGEEEKKRKNIPQIISSLILGFALSGIIFSALLLAGLFFGLLNVGGTMSDIVVFGFVGVVMASIALLLAIVGGFYFAFRIQRNRVRALEENSPTAQKREISLYILAGFLVLVVCCVGALALLISAN